MGRCSVRESRLVVAIVMSVALVGLASCGGGGGGGGGGPSGTFLVDFESLTASPNTLPNPANIGAGASVSGSSDMYVLGVGLTWNLGSCNALPTSGTQFFGNSQTGGTFEIVFDSPVQVASFRLAAAENSQVTVRFLDSVGGELSSVGFLEGTCPLALDLLGYDATTNRIKRISITGTDVALDDLAFTRL